MKKGIFVELVILQVGGGVLTDELAVQRVDVEAYAPSAINYALNVGRNTSIAQEGNRDLPSMFYGTFSDVDIDRSTSPANITLPKGYVGLYGNEGVRAVFDDCGNYYSPLMDADRRLIKAYKDKFIGQGFYYPIGTSKLEVYPTNPIVTKLNGEYIVDFDGLEDEDELPLPAGTEEVALDLCVKWFMGQRQTPADLLDDKTDNANEITK